LRNSKLCEKNQDIIFTFFNHIQNITMACVVLYHAVTAYSNVTPQFSFHDAMIPPQFQNFKSK
ncbi:hypothetical protein QUF58_10340, partial [Anaerolineales bacterium HSG24]|nr:hypothetical protein [Anaerolineales bacterium HSG24]